MLVAFLLAVTLYCLFAHAWGWALLWTVLLLVRITRPPENPTRRPGQ